MYRKHLMIEKNLFRCQQKIKCEEYEKIETAGFFRSDTSIGGKR